MSGEKGRCCSDHVVFVVVIWGVAVPTAVRVICQLPVVVHMDIIACVLKVRFTQVRSGEITVTFRVAGVGSNCLAEA
jgi:hypothetical protein